ncbi:hypothetical protein [Variovorax ginsengisoli]|uniref:Uncharacterized protein n=1 Tax=Variovorax ginsengisoli TaxID=363844 RepID=A0ABT8SFY2_9BURK|nr:hypothetical protein [Variovorax ginsengisoli]MDN8618074.1 hypothetical protein [Variovorax ginsengisoli]MDO1537244.1 hypothetical protein [Variovorax ginsengisoli]
MTNETSMQEAAAFELQFRSLYAQGRALAFPCDSEGHVDLDHFTERLRNNYLYARAMLGRQYAWPRVARSGPQSGLGS